MSLKGLSGYIEITKEKYNILFPEKIKIKVEQKKFREFINLHKDIFLWEEETSLGKKTLEEIESFPDRELVLRDLNEFHAYAFYKKDKGYYALDIVWNPAYGLISINFNNSRVTIPALEILLQMANYCDAMLLVRGKKHITKEFIEKEKLEINQRKTFKHKS